MSSPTLQKTETKLFYYQNMTSQIQLIRLFQGDRRCFEKVVFPGDRLIFEASSDSDLDIAIHLASGLVLRDRFPCEHLQEVESAA